MSKQLYSNLLTALNKANKARKLVLAGRAGYESVDEYKNFLEKQVSSYEDSLPSITESPKKVNPTIHVVDLVDCSGSMYGNKLDNANEGINDGVDKLKANIDPVTYKYTSLGFSGRTEFDVKYSNVEIQNVNKQKFPDLGSTALYLSIIKTFELINTFKNPEDKVLINIYTDGGDNDSKEAERVKAAKLIKSKEVEGYTVTFIGTKHDTDNVIRRLNIDESNTSVYDGTGEGLKASMDLTSAARAVYSAKVVKGEDVTKGFYKNIKK